MKRSMDHYFPYLLESRVSSRGRSHASIFVTEILEQLCTLLSITAEGAQERGLDRGECSAMVCENWSRGDIMIKQCQGCKMLDIARRSVRRHIGKNIEQTAPVVDMSASDISPSVHSWNRTAAKISLQVLLACIARTGDYLASA
ncbi:hypothetical protein PHLGIDRAFT_329320 [Phlebiopsis gigantea 11061_1 CR5-6]|uniref:Uncharacterized protein n=1 Tax=Phlebiopsis gigantea (strain 11061_1 CR5-6) TaxID=745531 RepID=A0A0C3PWE9_PHLG1|nr:hypothetical protein PHLGIDRAFT_329320 [Phlebiopsis gigantea 11061_1 CR5-6]